MARYKYRARRLMWLHCGAAIEGAFHALKRCYALFLRYIVRATLTPAGRYTREDCRSCATYFGEKFHDADARLVSWCIILSRGRWRRYRAHSFLWNTGFVVKTSIHISAFGSKCVLYLHDRFCPDAKKNLKRAYSAFDYALPILPTTRP